MVEVRVNPFSLETVFIRHNLTPVDVREDGPCTERNQIFLIAVVP